MVNIGEMMNKAIMDGMLQAIIIFIPYPVRSYFNLVTKNAVFMRSVAFCKRLDDTL